MKLWECAKFLYVLCTNRTLQSTTIIQAWVVGLPLLVIWDVSRAEERSCAILIDEKLGKTKKSTQHPLVASKCDEIQGASSYIHFETVALRKETNFPRKRADAHCPVIFYNSSRKKIPFKGFLRQKLY